MYLGVKGLRVRWQSNELIDNLTANRTIFARTIEFNRCNHTWSTLSPWRYDMLGRGRGCDDRSFADFVLPKKRYWAEQDKRSSDSENDRQSNPRHCL